MPSPSCHQCLEARGTTGPEVTRVGGLPLAPTNSGEQAQYLPGQHNRANPVSRGVGEPALELKVWKSCPHDSPVMQQWGWGDDLPIPATYHLPPRTELTLPLANCSTQESRSCSWPGQHSRADPLFRSEGDPALLF